MSDEARIEQLERTIAGLGQALQWIYAEPTDPVKVQLWARAALEELATQSRRVQ